MTDEQIKQNAEEYASELVERAYHEEIWLDLYDDFIAGAHSRDEEVKKLSERVEELQEYARTLRHVIDRDYNPWISVKNRLPEKLENDCSSDYVLTRIDGPRQVWYIVNKYDYDIKAWKGCNSNTTHWMPIPKLKKGE